MEGCSDSCCNPTTCKFNSGAVCSDYDPCCASCQFKYACLSKIGVFAHLTISGLQEPFAMPKILALTQLVIWPTIAPESPLNARVRGWWVCCSFGGLDPLVSHKLAGTACSDGIESRSTCFQVCPLGQNASHLPLHPLSYCYRENVSLKRRGARAPTLRMGTAILFLCIFASSFV